MFKTFSYFLYTQLKKIKFILFVRFSYYICTKLETMVNLSYGLVEKEIIRTIEEINESTENIALLIDEDFCPGNLIMSQILLTAMVRIGRKLDVIIPDSCYIFHDKKAKMQLSIKDATLKLIKEANYGNKKHN